MKDQNYIFADPWLKKARKNARLPKDASLACAYDLNLGPVVIQEATFFRRTEMTDELWVAAGEEIAATVRDIAIRAASPRSLAGSCEIGRVFAVPKKYKELTSCLKLLNTFFRARVGFYWPGRFVAAGIVKKSAFRSLLGQIEHELEENAQKARQTETEIIKVARELELSPEPTGTGPSFWQARCPEKNHPLYIDAVENSFGCGWCRRKGGVEELRALVKERKDRRTNSLSRRHGRGPTEFGR